MSTPTKTAFQITPKADRVSPEERAALLTNPGFGRVFSEHMAVVTYTEGKGWHTPQILPRGPLTLDPAASVLHYAQEIFEGMKAYRAPNGDALLFRPDANARRFRVGDNGHMFGKDAAKTGVGKQGGPLFRG
ncbi:hypothetical protein AD953_13440, partial [Acetobacter malorum]